MIGAGAGAVRFGGGVVLGSGEGVEAAGEGGGVVPATAGGALCRCKQPVAETSNASAAPKSQAPAIGDE